MLPFNLSKGSWVYFDPRGAKRVIIGAPYDFKVSTGVKPANPYSLYYKKCPKQDPCHPSMDVCVCFPIGVPPGVIAVGGC